MLIPPGVGPFARHDPCAALAALRRGASAEEARQAASDLGWSIPDDYIAEMADNQDGWVFRAPGTEGDAGIIRVGYPNAQNPNGYVRKYNEQGRPVDADGNALGTAGVGQRETHHQFPPDEEFIGE